MDEPSFLLRWVAWHVVSGDALFLGWGGLVWAVWLGQRKARRARVTSLALLAVTWIMLGVWPAGGLPQLLIAAVSAWLICLWRQSIHWQSRCGVLVTGVVLVSALGELPRQWSPRSLWPVTTSVAVIGDSVTAGLEARDRTWPRVLAETTTITVYDASQQGATVMSAQQQLQRLDGRGDVLVLIIGGNDILEGHSGTGFADELRKLVQMAHERYPRLVLFEIAAPPGHAAAVAAQRRIAAEFQVPVISRRQLLSVITGGGNTQDGIHLSDQGQARLAEIVRLTLGVPVGTSTGNYHRLEP